VSAPHAERFDFRLGMALTFFVHEFGESVDAHTKGARNL
jgi:hypothetical protein